MLLAAATLFTGCAKTEDSTEPVIIKFMTFSANPKSGISLDDTQYGLPYSFSNVVLIYNKELFAQAGIDYPTSGWTWDDADAAGEKTAQEALDDAQAKLENKITLD